MSLYNETICNPKNIFTIKLVSTMYTIKHEMKKISNKFYM